MEEGKYRIQRDRLGGNCVCSLERNVFAVLGSLVVEGVLKYTGVLVYGNGL